MSASDALCAKMREYFGAPAVKEGEPLPRPNPAGPIGYLVAKGYAMKDGKLLPPAEGHVPTHKQLDCIEFLRAEQPK